MGSREGTSAARGFAWSGAGGRAGLRALGVDAVYGAPLDGVPVVEVDTDLAPLLAEAHRRLRRRPAGIHRGDGAVDRLGGPAGTGAGAGAGGAVTGTRRSPDDGVVAALDTASAPVVLAGPGVVDAGAVPGLHALAAAGSLGVLNTWGAKGVFDWRSRHHLATVGLQEQDLARGGLGDADLVVATGVDRREAVGGWHGFAPVVPVAPEALAPLAERWGRARHEVAMPPLRADLGRVTQAGWQVDTGPLPPSRVTRHYGEVLGGDGLVAADPGVAGYWVARTFGTTRLGGAQVPADPAAGGFAVACVIVAGLVEPGRPALAVVDELGDVHDRLLDVAGRLGVPVPVEVWSDHGHELDAAAHRRRLERLVATGGWSCVATDPRQMDEMVEVAGPVVAWRQPPDL